MKKQACIVGLILVIAAVAAIIYFGDIDLGIVDPFDNEGRYDSTILNNMGVIYSNQSDIAHWNNGYSDTDQCPWGAVHNGLDYMFYNNSPVIAAAPGFVEDIELGYLPNSTIYVVGVTIRFNSTLTHQYGFEGGSTDESVRAQQVAMLDVEIGDWVVKGEQIGRFLRPTEFDHIHFAVYINEAICPRLVMGDDDYNEIMSLIDTFHPDWELCYP
ncbi:M23 family metallopeptidase [Candidatus Thorarchaeota archaeon]|nr:M23 family metallopeptidase [Candidatus Thorarchaeota archaeon]TFG94357.1 MAG: M23 family metallopeptidase [Candidatus Thorarchaeota archaeon]